MSHELRTPMNQIIGGTRILRGAGLNPDQQSCLNMINKAAYQLLSMSDDILYITGAAGSMMTPQGYDFPLTGIIFDLFAQGADRAKAKGLVLKTAIDPGVPARVFGDPEMLSKALLNYIKHGVKFTKHGSVTETIRTLQSDDAEVLLRFEVRDTDIGIEPKARERLFASFVQADDSFARHHGGIGLGLAIKQQLVRLMGGEVGVESEPGKSTFWLTARFKTAQTQAIADRLREEVVRESPD